MPTAGISSACLSSGVGQLTNKSIVTTVAKIIVMAFDKENNIFFDTKIPPLHKKTIEKSIDDRISCFNVYILLTFPKEAERSGQAFVEFSIQDVTTPGIVAHNK